MRECVIVRVFTRGRLGGNHLGVVTDVVGLDSPAMQAIAASLGFSESTFIEVQRDGVPFVRIFTPKDELPFAGHPLVGSAWVLAHRGETLTGLRCGIGDVGVRQAAEVVWIDVPMDGEIVDADDVVAYLARGGIPGVIEPGRVMIPKEYVLGRLATFDGVASLEPDMDVMAEVFGVLVYARNGDQVLARFFAPGTGVEEDPATGSAAVALATLLSARGETSGGVTIRQGESIGHPSRIELRWSGRTASIGGTVVLDEVRRLDR
jgi:trans-2,3-dihydro-3-hydroxyanthranilate isomerase